MLSSFGRASETDPHVNTMTRFRAAFQGRLSDDPEPSEPRLAEQCVQGCRLDAFRVGIHQRGPGRAVDGPDYAVDNLEGRLYVLVSVDPGRDAGGASVDGRHQGGLGALLVVIVLLDARRVRLEPPAAIRESEAAVSVVKAPGDW